MEEQGSGETELESSSSGAVSASDVPEVRRYISAAQIAQVSLALHEVEIEFEKTQTLGLRDSGAYLANLQKQRDDLTRQLQGLARTFRDQQSEARLLYAERQAIQKRLADLDDRIKSMDVILDMTFRVLTPEDSQKDAEATLLRERKAAIEAEAAAEQKKLDAIPENLSLFVADAERVNLLEQAAANIKGLRVTRQIRQENLRRIQSELDALAEPLSDVLKEAARFDRIEEAYRQMDTWIGDVKLALNPVDVRVVEASEPNTPIRPIWQLNMAFSSFVGLAAGAALALIGGIPKGRRRTLGKALPRMAPSDGELRAGPIAAAASRLPHDAMLSMISRALLGVIPHREALNSAEAPLSLRTATADPQAASAFREITDGLRSGDPARARRVLLVTSGTGLAGKSTVALLSAWSCAEAGEKVLLIDARLTEPHLHLPLECAPGPGLADALNHGSIMPVYTQKTCLPNVFLLPAGQTCAEGFVLQHQIRLEELIAAARGAFDRVIVDSGPVLNAVDTLVLASRIRNVVYVVQGGRRYSLVMRGAETLLRFGPRVAIVINNALRADYDPTDFFRYALRREGFGRVISDTGWWRHAEAAEEGEVLAAKISPAWKFEVLSEQPGLSPKDEGTGDAETSSQRVHRLPKGARKDGVDSMQ